MASWPGSATQAVRGRAAPLASLGCASCSFPCREAALALQRGTWAFVSSMALRSAGAAYHIGTVQACPGPSCSRKTPHSCTRAQEWRAPPFYTDRDVEGSPRKGGGAAVLPSTVARGDASFRFYRHQRRVNWAGSAVVALFCLALVFYVYVRVTRTLFGLGRFTGYGIFVLLVRARRLRACYV